ncbi:MAG: RtcB family protein [Spirochaetes bacterium]|nr:RtcB family protein [Spirochaetota bacterium]
MSIETKRIDKYRIQMFPTDKMKIPALIYASQDINLENDALLQLQNAASIDKEALVFATPDIHKGYGIPIGSILASPNFISPSAVGYDINCGMRLLSTGLTASEVDIKKLANSIRNDIPLGEGKSNLIIEEKEFIRLLKRGVQGLEEISNTNKLDKIFNIDDWQKDINKIEENGSIKGGDLSQNLDKAIRKGKSQLGTLGGGNHFIELQVVTDIYDEKISSEWNINQGELVLMIHSGSRGFGYEIADQFMKKSLAFCEKNKLFLPDKQFSYFPVESLEGKEYLKAMILASNFAFLNREIMTMFVRYNIRKFFPALDIPLVYDISHNIVKEEKYDKGKYFVHRKGATRAFDKERMNNTHFAKTGQPVLIPGSMGTASYLLCGIKSGEESFFSVNHGSGRVMGRRAAAGKKNKKGKVIREALISDADFIKQMEGVYLICEHKASIKEEAPAAYKDINVVIDTVIGAGLAKKIAKFKPLAVLKG